MFTLSNVAVASVAVILAGRQVAANPSTIHQLLGRQIDGLDYSQVPAECQSACSPLSESLSGCTSVECICSETNIKAIASCMSCAIGLAGSEVTVATGQDAVDQFRDACKSAGVELQAQTVTQGNQGNGASSQHPAIIAGALAASALFLALN
ncbi:hypothetical protein ONZ45_g11318 [Pleurotus djamor]|nr:hypothetical protein ONZ45_g11318 [Pleurotus djamor]